ncbi:MAG TPA: AtpZ/AtpI family protein [Candidatus Saccharimonadales bacterium]|nr:AtpZ/AtpI family protein [Candidatus Saccharimonadales bacterium]
MIATNRGGIVVRAMTKSAGKTTTSVETIKKAKRLFFAGLVDISWRLAVAIILPIVAGYWLDNKMDSGNLFTLIGLLFGTILAGLVIYRTYKTLNKEINDL